MQAKLKAFYRKNQLEAGCDEAGRGCLAGPVFAAAVILPADFYHPLLNDSKTLSLNKREELREIITKEAISWAVASLDNQKIDKINILKASIQSMHLALDQLNRSPEFILIDGNRFLPYKKTPHQCVVKGDGKYASIAAASILAKTYRDDYMLKIHEEYPVYDWKKNKGYPTKKHREALATHGTSPYHRQSFRLFDTQTKIPF